MPPRLPLFLALAALPVLSAVLSAPARADDAALIVRGGFLYGRTSWGGALYGRTSWGAAKSHGYAFRLRRDGSGFQVLRASRALGRSGVSADGSGSHAELTEGRDGFLYGTRTGGDEDGEGVVFRRRPDGAGFRVLHSFEFCDTDMVGANYGGAGPEEGLILRDDGFLYGTARYGGQGGRGVVFRLRRDGSGFQVLHNFHTEDNTSASIFRGAYPVNADGDVPDTGLTEGRDGFLYGIAEGGGVNGGGVVYRLRPDGSGFRVVHAFPAPPFPARLRAKEDRPVHK